MKIKIYEATSEMEASITRGYLESNGIQAFIAPGQNSLGNNPRVLRGPNVSYDVFVEEEKAEEAKRLITERNTA